VTRILNELADEDAARWDDVAHRQERLVAVERLTSMNIDLGLDPNDPNAYEKMLEEIYAQEDAEYDAAFVAQR